MERDDVDTELFDLLVRFVVFSQHLRDGTLDAAEAHLERMELAMQLRQRGFMIAEPQIGRLDERLLH